MSINSGQIERMADQCVEIQTHHLEASLLPEMARYKPRFLGRSEKVTRPEVYDPPELREKGHLKLIVNNG